MSTSKKRNGFLILKLRKGDKLTITFEEKKIGTLQLVQLESTVCKFIWESKNQSQELYIPKATFVEFKFLDNYSIRFSYNKGTESYMSLAIQGEVPINVYRGEHIKSRI